MALVIFQLVYGLPVLLGEVLDLGIPTATELLDPITPQYLADSLSWAAIGARTSESQTHRQMASGLSMPVGFKNATSGDIKAAVNGIIAATQSQTFLGLRRMVVPLRNHRRQPRLSVDFKGWYSRL